MNDLNELYAKVELLICEKRNYVELFVIPMNLFPISFQKLNIVSYVFTTKTVPIF